MVSKTRKQADAHSVLIDAERLGSLLGSAKESVRGAYSKCLNADMDLRRAQRDLKETLNLSIEPGTSKLLNRSLEAVERAIVAFKTAKGIVNEVFSIEPETFDEELEDEE